MNDLHSFGSWSPYEKKDPAMKRTFTGAASGRGAGYMSKVMCLFFSMDNMIGKDFEAGLSNLKTVAET
jgi:hypothetical protein